MSEHAEVCYSGSNTKTTFANEHQPDSLYEQLINVFPWVRREEYFSISEPTHHEIIDEPVITCCMPLPQAEALFGEQTVLGARKFCMESGTSFVRSYEVFSDEKPEWMPESAQMLFIGRNFEEFRRPFPEITSRFVDLYFSGDPDDVEQTFALSHLRGEFSTYYGATVLDGVVSRVKQYCYDKNGTAADWQRVYDWRTGRISG